MALPEKILARKLKKREKKKQQLLAEKNKKKTPLVESSGKRTIIYWTWLGRYGH